MAEEKSSRNYLIDFLRLIAASWVVLFHLNEPILYINNWYRNFCKYGHLGVPVFFVISGYCIYLASLHSKNPKEFLIKRFFRIFPPFWFSIFVVCLSVLFGKTLYGVNFYTALPKTIGSILANVTLTTIPFTNVPTINWVYWTLTYELFFYLLIFLSLLLSFRLRVIWLFAITLISIFIKVPNVGVLFFLNQWGAFCLGISIYRINNRMGNIWLNSSLLVLCLFSLYTNSQNLSYIVTCIIIVLLLYINHYRPLRNNLLSRLGDFSYSIYLIHVPIAVYIFGFVKSNMLVQTNLYLNFVADFAELILVIMIAKLMYYKVELPSINLGRIYIKKFTIKTD